MFLGAKRTIEWAFSRLIAIQHYQNRPWTAIQVANRQKVTGITYDAANEHNLRLRLEAALALFNGERAELEAQLHEALSAHDAARPAAALTAAPTAAPAWYRDPTKRHEYRYWNGARWTDAVADRGVQSVDPP